MIASRTEIGRSEGFVEIFVEEFRERFLQRRRAAGFEPLPTLVAPVLRLAIAAVFDEFEKLAVGYRRPGDAKRFEHDLMGPLLVVEDEGEILGRADQVFATGDLDVTRTGAAIDGGRPLTLGDRRRIAQGLARVGQGFGMHAFVEGGEPVEVKFFRPKLKFAGDTLAAALEDFVHVAQCVIAVGQQQLPARVMSDIGGVVQPVAMFPYRFLAIQVAQNPKFLSPRHMADLPERRIDDCQARSDQLPLVKIGDQAEQAVAELAHGCDQLAHVHSGEEIGSCAGDRRLHLGICRENS